MQDPFYENYQETATRGNKGSASTLSAAISDIRLILPSHEEIIIPSKSAAILNFSFFNLLTTSVSHIIETSQLICRANQLTGFYIMGNICR